MRLLTLLILVVTTSVSAQTTDYGDLAERLTEYGRLNEALEVDSLLMYIEPSLFDIVPREVMAAQFEQLLDSTDMVFTLSGFEFDAFGEPVRREQTDYVLVPYRGGIAMRLRSEEMLKPETVENMKGMFELSYGEENVRLDSTNLTFHIQLHNRLVAIRHGAEPWYFIEFKPQLATAIEPILPEEVRRALKLE